MQALKLRPIFYCGTGFCYYFLTFQKIQNAKQSILEGS